jgi:ABC-type nitrate/sulfonate/bicarbonate transport system substrate-binding protein
MLLSVIFLLALAPHAEARKVQVAVATFSQSVLPLVVAQEKGYYREEDLDVQLILMTASVANMALLGDATLTKRGAFHSFEFRVSGLGLVIQFKTRN